MSSPVLVLAAAWLLVIGYGLVYIGYSNLSGKSVTFVDAFGLKGGGIVSTGSAPAGDKGKGPIGAISGLLKPSAKPAKVGSF